MIAKLLSCAISLCLLSFLITSIYPKENVYRVGWHDTEYTFDDFDSVILPVQNNDLQETCDAASILDLLCQAPINFAERLKYDLYKYSNGPFQTRSLLDLPSFFLSETINNHDFHFTVWDFYNQTTHAVYRTHGTNINAYLNIEDENLLDGISQLGLSIDINGVLEIVKRMRIQERRTGCMLGAYKSWGAWTFEFKTPLYYRERNFYFYPAEEKALKKALGIAENMPYAISQKELNKKAASDQIGLGDTRLSVAYRHKDDLDAVLDIGLDCSIPTAFAFVKGLIGSDFARNDITPPLDIKSLVCMMFADSEQASQALASLRSFGETAFAKLAANLLQTGLGNQGHVGIAPFVYYACTLAEHCDLTAKGAVEYIFGRTEKRFFILRKNPELLSCDAPGQEEQKLNYLNNVLLQTLIPRVIETHIHPGFIAKAACCLSYSIAQRWQIGVGCDGWWQSAEHFGTLHTDSQTLSTVYKHKAKRPSAYQAKLMARILYDTQIRNYDFGFMLQADYSILNRAIGKDFTLALKIMIDL